MPAPSGSGLCDALTRGHRRWPPDVRAHRLSAPHKLSRARGRSPTQLSDPTGGARVRRLEPADLPSVFQLDACATAEDRSVPLAVLAEGEGWVLDDEGELRGFLLPTERAHGVIVAPRFEDGLFLLELHRNIVPGGALVRACVPDEHAAAPNPVLEPGAAISGELLLKEAVQPLAGVGGLCLEFQLVSIMNH